MVCRWTNFIKWRHNLERHLLKRIDAVYRMVLRSICRSVFFEVHVVVAIKRQIIVFIIISRCRNSTIAIHRPGTQKDITISGGGGIVKQRYSTPRTVITVEVTGISNASGICRVCTSADPFSGILFMVITCEVYITVSFSHQSGSFIPLIHKVLGSLVLFYKGDISIIRRTNDDIVWVLTHEVKAKEELGFYVRLYILIITARPISADAITWICHIRKVLACQHHCIDFGCRDNGRTVVTTSVQREETLTLYSDIIVHRTVKLGNGVGGFVCIDNIIFGSASCNSRTFCNGCGACLYCIENTLAASDAVVEAFSRSTVTSDILWFIIGKVLCQRTLIMRRQLDSSLVIHDNLHRL